MIQIKASYRDGFQLTFFSALREIPSDVPECRDAGRVPPHLQRDRRPDRAVLDQRPDRVHGCWLCPRPGRVGRAAHQHRRRGLAPSGGTDARHGSLHRRRQRGFRRRQAKSRAPGAAVADRAAADDPIRLSASRDRVPLTRDAGDGPAGRDAGADGRGARQACRDESDGAACDARRSIWKAISTMASACRL